MNLLKNVVTRRTYSSRLTTTLSHPRTGPKLATFLPTFSALTGRGQPFHLLFARPSSPSSKPRRWDREYGHGRTRGQTHRGSSRIKLRARRQGKRAGRAEPCTIAGVPAVEVTKSPALQIRRLVMVLATPAKGAETGGTSSFMVFQIDLPTKRKIAPGIRST